MIDSISAQRVALLHPRIREEVFKLLDQVDIALSGRAGIRVTQGYRTFAEQDALYAKGRTKPGPKVTNSKGGQSMHNYRLALDFCLIIDNKQVSWDTLKDYDGDKLSDWMEVVSIFKNAGFTWGGDFKSLLDKPHLEKNFGYTWQQLLQKYKNKEFEDSDYLKL